MSTETDNLLREQKEALVKVENAMVEKIDKKISDISEKSYTKEDVDKLVKKAIDTFALANSSLPADMAAKRVAEFKTKYFWALVQKNQGDSRPIMQLMKDYSDMWDVNSPAFSESEKMQLRDKVDKAAITSASTTFTNVTPVVYYNEVLSYAKNLTFQREIARVFPNAGRSGVVPVGTGTRMTGYRNGEGVAVTDSAPTMGAGTYTCKPLSVGLPVSNELLNQWSIAAFEPWIVSELAYGFYAKELSEFTVGTGMNDQYTGYETEGVGEVSGGTNYVLLRKLYRSVPMQFRPMAEFVCTSATIALIETIQDPAGRYLIDIANPITTLFGRPLHENGYGTDYDVYFGWWNRYGIFTNGMTMSVDNSGQTNRSTNCTYFHLTESNAGKIMDTNAFRFCTLDDTESFPEA